MCEVCICKNPSQLPPFDFEQFLRLLICITFPVMKEATVLNCLRARLIRILNKLYIIHCDKEGKYYTTSDNIFLNT